MTYSDVHGQYDFKGIHYSNDEIAFFNRLDQEFYNWNRPLHHKRPFDRLFPYEKHGEGSKILEIGCGLGTMAMNWALNGSQVTAVDLNEVAVDRTRKRFALLGLDGDIHQEDANALSFGDGQFDYTYSWGVLHHSPDLKRSISELMRVTASGGEFGIMVYNRRSVLHWYMTEYIEGFLHYEKRFLDPLQLASRYGDGAREEGNPYTWPVTVDELTDLIRPYSQDFKVKILGTDLDSVFKYVIPGLGLVLPTGMKKVWARRYGWSIWASGYRS